MSDVSVSRSTSKPSVSKRKYRCQSLNVASDPTSYGTLAMCPPRVCERLVARDGRREPVGELLVGAPHDRPRAREVPRPVRGEVGREDRVGDARLALAAVARQPVQRADGVGEAVDLG